MSDETMDAAQAPVDHFTIEVPAEVSALAQVVVPLREQLLAHGCPVPAVDTVVVAVEELFVNVASYAYGDAVGEARIDYRFEGTEGGGTRVVIAIEDEGIPFDPTDHPEPVMPTRVEDVKIGGLGILMVRRYADRFTYERDGATNRTTITRAW